MSMEVNAGLKAQQCIAQGKRSDTLGYNPDRYALCKSKSLNTHILNELYFCSFRATFRITYHTQGVALGYVL